MVIRFKKKPESQHIMTCIREDGSQTYTKLKSGLEAHDLAHFAVESVLDFKKGFYGLLNEGHQIQDFEIPRNKRPAELMLAHLPVQAIQVEYIVNQLVVEYWNGNLIQAFIAELSKALSLAGIDFPAGLNDQVVDEIREKFQSLMHQWDKVQVNEELILEF